MKICMVSEYFPPRIIGGGEYSAYMYAQGLVRQGHEVHVLTAHPRHSISRALFDPMQIQIYENKDGIHIHRILGVKTLNLPLFRFFCMRGLFHLHSLVTIIRFILREKPDVVHALNIDSIPASVMAAKIFKIPVVATINSHAVTCPKGTRLNNEDHICQLKCSFSRMTHCLLSSMNQRGWRERALVFYSFMMWSLLKISLKAADSVTAISGYVKNTLIQIGIPANRIKVVPVIADRSTFAPAHVSNYNRAAIREKFGFLPKDKIVLYVGAVFDFRKGSDLLINSIPLVVKAVPNAKFLIVGDVPSRELALIKDRNLKQYVIFFGHIPNRQLADIYAISDVVVAPSLWPEPFGRVLIEAMGMEKPIIASKVGGITDIIQDKVNGLLVKPNNIEELAGGIIRMLEEKDLAKKMGEAGRKTVETKFSEETVIGKMVEAYGVGTRPACALIKK